MQHVIVIKHVIAKFIYSSSKFTLGGTNCCYTRYYLIILIGRMQIRSYSQVTCCK